MGDCDAGEFSDSKLVRARKQHECIECRAPIATGESYEYAKGRSDGFFWDSHTCVACIEIRRAFVCGNWLIGCLWEEIRDQLFPEWNEMTAIDCLAKLTTDATIAKMRAKYAEYEEDRA